jgi:hypothetical protein
MPSLVHHVDSMAERGHVCVNSRCGSSSFLFLFFNSHPSCSHSGSQRLHRWRLKSRCRLLQMSLYMKVPIGPFTLTNTFHPASSTERLMTLPSSQSNAFSNPTTILIGSSPATHRRHPSPHCCTSPRCPSTSTRPCTIFSHEGLRSLLLVTYLLLFSPSGK